MASSENTNVLLVSGDRATTESLFALIQPHGCPRRVATLSQIKDGLRPYTPTNLPPRMRT